MHHIVSYHVVHLSHCYDVYHHDYTDSCAYGYCDYVYLLQQQHHVFDDVTQRYLLHEMAVACVCKGDADAVDDEEEDGLNACARSDEWDCEVACCDVLGCINVSNVLLRR